MVSFNNLPPELVSHIADALSPRSRTRLEVVDQALAAQAGAQSMLPSPRTRDYYRRAQQSEWGDTALNDPALEGNGAPTAPQSYQERQQASHRACLELTDAGNSLAAFPRHVDAVRAELSRRYGCPVAAENGLSLLQDAQMAEEGAASPKPVRRTDYHATRRQVEDLLAESDPRHAATGQVSAGLPALRPPLFFTEPSPSALRAPRRAARLHADEVFEGAPALAMGLEDLFEAQLLELAEEAAQHEAEAQQGD